MNDLISRQDAIEALRKNKLDGDEDFNTGINTCIAILDTLPSAEPSGELISREDAIRAMAENLGGGCSVWAYFKLQDALKALPSADTPTTDEKHQLSVETSTDLISRADAIEAIQNAYCKPCKERGDDHNEVRCRVCEYDNAIIQIDALPSAEPTAEEVWSVAQKVFHSTLTYREAVDYVKEVEKQHERYNQPSGCD